MAAWGPHRSSASVNHGKVQDRHLRESSELYILIKVTLDALLGRLLKLLGP